MTSVLPALPITAPLICAPLCLLLRSPKLSSLLACMVAIFCLLCAGRMIFLTYGSSAEALIYHFGGWPPPWGIAYRVTSLNALLATLIALVATLVLSGAYLSMAKESPNLRGGRFFALFLLCLAGLMGVVLSNDIFNIFVCLEISSLCTYALIATSPDRIATLASFRYLIMGSIGATFFLIGIALIYFATGTLNLQDIAQRLPGVTTRQSVYAAYAFIATGLALKFALFPVHQWLPAAYSSAPSPVTTFISATSSKAALYVFIYLFVGTFASDQVLSELSLGKVLLGLSAIAILYASVKALRQKNIKKMMAWSSVAQIGYITLAIGLATERGISAGMIHIFNHGLIKSGIFLALACVAYRLGSCHIDELAGLGKRMPWTTTAIILGGLSLSGVPLSAGFISKWYLIEASLDAGYWPLIAVILAGSLLSFGYLWRFVEAACFRSSKTDPVRQEAPLALLLPSWILIGLNLFFGVHAEPIVNIARHATAELMGMAL